MLPTVRPTAAITIILAFFALAVIVITATVHNALAAISLTTGA